MPGHRFNATRILPLLTALAVGALSACGAFASTASTSPASTSPAMSGSAASSSAASSGGISVSPAVRGGSQAIPQLAGDTVSVAELYLQQAGLRAGHTLPKANTRYQNGLVIATFPYAGDVVPSGFVVSLLVSTGSPGCQSSPQQVCPQITLSMPDVTGETIDQATTTLAMHDITLGSYVVEPSSAAKGTVICTDPRAGEAVSESEPVKAGVSSGDPDSPPAGFCETASGSPPTSPATSPPASSSGPPPTSPSGTPPTSPSSTPPQSPSSPALPSASP